MMRKLTTLSLLVAAAAASVLAQQPDPAQMAMQYGESSKQNAMALRHYSWKMRVAVTVEGEPKSTQLYQMRFDLDGKLQKTAIGGEEAKKKKVRGPARKRIAEKKMSKVKEYVGKVSDLVKTYAHPTPGNMLDFFSRATFAPTAAGQVEIKGTDFLQPGDSATFWIDSATGQTRTYAFRTSMAGDPVNGQVDFQTLQDGPSYAARVSISVPDKSLSAVVENFDYIRQ